MSLKSPLGRVLGLGSAKSGTEHWWSQRLTAIAMVPLSLWFVVQMFGMSSFDYNAARAFVAAPVNAILLLLLTFTLLYHSMLGTQVVVEDYVRGARKVVMLVVLRFAYIALGVAAIFSILKISLGTA
ncbi:MAG: succinate dehydrogenase, hydrophobic membrane anchor protein [Pseudomonadota bacterium]